MAKASSSSAVLSLAAGMLSGVLAVGAGGSMAGAQTPAGSPSSQDKKFLKELDQDSNFEIKTAQLALQKSKSADVKQYATMLIHDHTQLKQKIEAADKVANLTPEDAGSMSLSDRATYSKLELLSGNTFDTSYIKGLVSGNEEIVKDEKTEAATSTVPSIRVIAARGAELDTKHAETAKQLAQAHGVKP